MSAMHIAVMISGGTCIAMCYACASMLHRRKMLHSALLLYAAAIWLLITLGITGAING
jgi:hypothetical protein